jgi:hypothetical protein
VTGFGLTGLAALPKLRHLNVEGVNVRQEDCNHSPQLKAAYLEGTPAYSRKSTTSGSDIWSDLFMAMSSHNNP